MKKGKKVSFGGKPTGVTNLNADSWVENREVQPKEVMKRLTIDVPVSLHKRIKSQCVLDGRIMADVIRDMLDQKFPANAGQGGPS